MRARTAPPVRGEAVPGDRCDDPPMTAPPPNGFRKSRFTDDDGSGYGTIFTSEYHGSAFASDTYAAPETRYEYTVVGDDDLTLRSMRAEGGRRGGVIGARGDHVVFWLTAGRLDMHFADRTRTVLPGTPYIASASEAYRFESEGTVYNGIHVADEFLRRVGRDLGFRLPEGPLLFDQQDEVIARREPLRRLIRELRCSLMDDRVLGPMRTALNRRLATVVLDTFPIRNRGDDVPVASRLRDAVRFIEEHAAERPGVGAIAAAAGLSERGLQEVFGRTLATTPTRFLRDHRLDQVRSELLRPGAPSAVAATARRWGFGNPGRFAAAYRERFGEDPSTTVASVGGQPGKPSWRLRKALEHIDQHLQETLSVSDIADAVGLRPRRLQQLFAAELGCTPMAHVRRVRADAERNSPAGIGNAD